MQAADELIGQLDNDGEVYFSGGRTNNIADLTLSIVTVLASLTAAALVATSLAKWVIALISAIPAATTSIQKITALRQRSNWYFSYSAQVRALATRLRYAISSPEEIAEAYAKLQVRMEGEWTKIGQSLAASRRRGRGSSYGSGKNH